MKLKVEIRRNSDGVIATDVWPDWNYNTFWFEEGNGACDCNRELFFSRASKEKEPDELECGDDRFSVRLSDSDTGEILYDELTPSPECGGGECGSR